LSLKNTPIARAIKANAIIDWPMTARKAAPEMSPKLTAHSTMPLKADRPATSRFFLIGNYFMHVQLVAERKLAKLIGEGKIPSMSNFWFDAR
jgi:hypothetical protein